MDTTAISGIYNYRAVDDLLCTSGQPSVAQLSSIATAGYRTIINLALHDDPRYSLPDERGTVEGLGLTYIHIPVQFATPTEENLAAFFDAMDAHRNQKMWVHCAANMRVTAFLGLYRMVRQSWEAARAFELMRGLWQPNEVWTAFIGSMLEKHGINVEAQELRRAMKQTVAINTADVPPRAKATNYPEPFASRMSGRDKRPLGDLFALTNFGVNLTRLAPNAISALRHAHVKQDEFVYILEGSPTLVTDEGRTQLAPGMCAGFKAGTGNAHQLINETTGTVLYLEIGDRTPGDGVSYPDDDLKATLVEGKWNWFHKDGSPY